MGGISGLIKSIKKKITLKGVIGTVAGVLGVGSQAPPPPPPPPPSAPPPTTPNDPTAGGLAKNPLVWIAAGLAALFLLRRR